MTDHHKKMEGVTERLVTGSNWFPFFRPWGQVFGKMTALFLQDLINRREMRKGKADADGYFLCTRKYLADPKMMGWSDKEQKDHFGKLKKLGVIHSKYVGLPARRWVKVDVPQLTRLMESAFQVVPIGTDWPDPNGTANKKKEPIRFFLLEQLGEAATADADRRTPEEKLTMDLNPLFTAATGKPSKKELPSTFDKEAATSIRKLCQSQNWPISLAKKNWADQFRLMRKEGHSQERIAEVLGQYVIAVDEGKTTFKVRDGKQFREQFDRLERIVAKLPAPASHRAKDIAKKSSVNYKWPKVTPEDVAAFAQKCISFADDLAVRLTKIKKRLEEKKGKKAEDRVLLNAVNALHVRVASCDSFALSHLKAVQAEVRKWKAWSGDLSMYIPKLSGDKVAGFWRTMQAAGVSATTWTILKGELK